MSSRKTPEWVIVFEKGKGNEEVNNTKFSELAEEIVKEAKDFNFYRKENQVITTKVGNELKKPDVLFENSSCKPTYGDYFIFFCFKKDDEIIAENKFKQFVDKIENLARDKGFPIKCKERVPFLPPPDSFP